MIDENIISNQQNPKLLGITGACDTRTNKLYLLAGG
jgi:hypothetical protein